jgi:phage-related baseplate assembly protein
MTAALYTYPGPDSSVVLAAAQAALDAYIASVRRVGFDITLSGIYAALHQPGVQRVNLTAPTANITINETSYGHCTAKTITLSGTDE